MNRKTALEVIRIEYATHGKPTQAAMRAYVENRIGFAAYTDVRLTGMKQYKEANKDDAQH